MKKLKFKSVCNGKLTPSFALSELSQFHTGTNVGEWFIIGPERIQIDIKNLIQVDHNGVDIWDEIARDHEADLKAARVEALEGIKEPCMDAIETVIKQYRCQFTMDADLDDMHLPLVDKLCPPQAVDISEGRREIAFLIDEVQGTVLELIKARQ